MPFEGAEEVVESVDGSVEVEEVAGAAVAAPRRGGGLRRSTLVVVWLVGVMMGMIEAVLEVRGAKSTKLVSLRQSSISWAKVRLAVILSPVTVLEQLGHWMAS